MKSFKTVLILALSLILALAFFGCKQDPNSGVAATVGDTQILEKDVTARIELFCVDQTTGEKLDDAAWAKKLQDSGLTPETLREYVIRNNFAIYDLLLQKAAALGIYPDATKIDEQVSQIKSSVEGSTGTFEEYLKSMGFGSEDAYRHALEAQDVVPSLLQEELKNKQPTQAEIDSYISENAAPYAGKRVSLVYFATDSEKNTEDVIRAKAEEALAKIESGADFAEVAAEYMAESAPDLAGKGGDLDWGGEGSLPQEARDALNELEIGQVSGIAETRIPQTTTQDPTTGATTSETASEESTEPLPDNVVLCIVKFTDEFVIPDATESSTSEGQAEGQETDGQESDAPETDSQETNGQETETPETADPTSATQTPGSDTTTKTVDVSIVPEDLKQKLTELCIQQFTQTAQQEYINALISSDEVVINPMPEGLSYAVDMSLADTVTEEGTEGEESEEEEDSENSENPPAPTPDASGLQTSDIVVGTGATAETGSVLQVHYTLYLEDGSVKESSYDTGTPYQFTLGAGGVIQGWDLGLEGMKVGGKRQLIVPPELAYGSQDYNGIPANSTLTFDLELVSVNGDSTGYSGPAVTPTEG